MSLPVALINAFIFFAISGLHFYWAMGGRWSKVVVIPTHEKTSKELFTPSVFSTSLVAVGLLAFGFVSLGSQGYFAAPWDVKYFLWANLLIGIIFLARAVGDFRYIGFSKRIKNTVFAKNDTRYYAPLSALLSLNSFLIFMQV